MDFQISPEWQVVHKYNKLRRRGLVPQLQCKNCSAPIITRLGKDDLPMIECLFCGHKVTPGQNFYDDLKEKINGRL